MMPSATKPVTLSRVVCFVLTGAIGLVLATFFDADPGVPDYNGLLFVYPFTVGAVLFCIYAPHLAERIRGDDLATFTIYGFGGSFAVWGSVLGCLFGGFFGALQALIITIVLYQAIKSKLIILGPLLFLIPAWFVATLVRNPLSRYIDHDAFLTWSTSAVFVWNALMFGLMAVIVPLAVRARANRRALEATLPCMTCGYSLVGLTADRCPECGTPIVRRPATPEPAHMPQSTPEIVS